MIKNKIYAILMLGLGLAPIALDGDVTCLVFMSMFAIPMFFSKKDWIY